jgi:hypothetical protein
MKVSKLIKELQALQEIEGDVDVFADYGHRLEVFDIGKLAFPSIGNRYIRINLVKIQPRTDAYREYCDIANGTKRVRR